jgi:hypothetical protein
MLTPAPLFIDAPRDYLRQLIRRIVQAIQFFWKFSLYYGQFVATPPWEHQIQHKIEEEVNSHQGISSHSFES